MIKGVVFDFDGTLVDTMDLIHRALNDALKKRDLPLVNADLLGRMAGRPVAEIMRVTTDVLDSAVRDVEQDIFDMYIQFCKTDCELLPNVKDVLKVLKSKGVKLGLFTTTPRRPLESAINRLGLKNYFDISLAKEDVKNKPNPDGLERIIEAFGIKKDECLYVGDSPSDIQAGNAAGIKTVAIPTGLSTAEHLREENPDLFITDLAQLLKYID
ncbi:MAG: HAD family hydrolase [Candidatus Bathyarchaeota archaeon]